MVRFTKKQIAATISSVLLFSSTTALAATNLLINGDFTSGETDPWIGGTAQGITQIPQVILDENLASNVLYLSNRNVHSATAKQTVNGLKAEGNYRVTGKLKMNGKVGLAYSYTALEATKLTTVTVNNTTVISDGTWIDFSGDFTLPADFDESKQFKIWVKSATSEAYPATENVGNVYADDLVLVDLNAPEEPEPEPEPEIASKYSDINSWSNDFADDYFVIDNLAGSKLKVMRLPVSDNLAQENASFDNVATWLATNSDWRFATKEEMIALTEFFDAETVADKSANFLELNASLWSPITSSNLWNALVPTEAQDPADASPAWGFTVKAALFGSVGYKKNFNASALGAAALVVSDTFTEEPETGPELSDPAKYSDNTTWENNVEEDFWTAKNINGEVLNIMRLPISDDLDSEVPDGKTSNIAIDNWLAENSDWSWASKEQFEAIHEFFDGADTTAKATAFLELNANEWSPKASPLQWVVMTKAEAQADTDASPAWKYTVKEAEFNNVAYGAATNANGLAAAALLVRVVTVTEPEPVLDSDGDGVTDENDLFPNDPTESSDNDLDGIGDNADNDDDNDGVIDEEDALPFDATETSDNDGDGIGDIADTDDDNDSVNDDEDIFPYDSNESVDTDLDGVGNNADSDDDDDGVSDTNDAFPLDSQTSVLAQVLIAETVVEGGVIEIDATPSAIGDSELTYSWTQVSGVAINLIETAGKFSISLPQVKQDELVELEVTIDNGVHAIVEQVSFTIMQTPAMVSAAATMKGGTAELDGLVTLNKGDVIELDASASTDSDSNQLIYSWVQTGGPAVKIDAKDSQLASFVVPNIASDAPISFAVTVTNGQEHEGAVASANVSAVVTGTYDGDEGGSLGFWSLILIGVSFIRRKYC